MRLRMLLLSAVIGLMLIVVGASPANAGGWWSFIHLNGRHFAVGENFAVHEELMFRNTLEAERAQGIEYNAYVMPSIDTRALESAMSRRNPGKWWTPPAELIHVGDVIVSRWETNAAFAEAQISIPEIRLGRYYLMLCSRGCEEPLADIVPLRIEVVDDPLVAQMARRLEATQEKAQLALQRMRHDLRLQGRRIQAAEADVSQVTRDVAFWKKRTEPVEKHPESVPWLTYLGWFAGGVGCATPVAMSRRLRAARDTTFEEIVERLPEEGRELAGSTSKR
jgi:hypothetical protein